jgi:hypothetical protein
MTNDAYERVVLDQIEAGLQLEGWKPRFSRLERRPWYALHPILFACLVALATALVMTALFLTV